jgi:general L-amino acid transport system permease protein
MIAAPLLALFLGGGSWEAPTTGRFGYQGGFVMMPEFMALVVGLSMYNATYVAEIVRSGFSSVPQGQYEAASSLGLTPLLTLRLVVFPQALRAIIPPLTTLYLNIFKGTSLAAAIAYPEVVSVFVGTVNNLVGQPVIIMAITALTYATISLGIALVLNWYNRRIAVPVQ